MPLNHISLFLSTLMLSVSMTQRLLCIHILCTHNKFASHTHTHTSRMCVHTHTYTHPCVHALRCVHAYMPTYLPTYSLPYKYI